MSRANKPDINELLPNYGSAHRTPASLSIDIHYAKLAVWSRWSWVRYLRLAAFLKLTPYELASLVCLPHRKAMLAEKQNKFDRPTALLLTLLEAHVQKEFSNDVIANPFPSLPEVPHA